MHTVNTVSGCCITPAEIIKTADNNPSSSWIAEKLISASNVACDSFRSAWNSKLTTIASGLCPLNLNIFQIGPQAHIGGYDLKGTSTVVLSKKNITIFPLHAELGYKLPGALGLNAYALCVYQCGWRYEFNGSINPDDWCCYWVTEKLEHVEVSYPYLETNILGFKGSIQAIISFETGKTRLFDKKDCLKIVPELLLKVPGALPNLIATLLTHFSLKSPDSSDNNSVISQQPPSINSEDSSEESSQSATFVKYMSDCIVKTLINGITHDDAVYWFGSSLSTADLNSAITWGSNPASFSLQLNNYPRKNFMFTWENGKFSLPSNIVEYLTILKQLFASQEKLQLVVNEVMKKASSAPDLTRLNSARKTQATTAIKEFSNKLHDVITTLPDTGKDPLSNSVGQNPKAGEPVVSIKITLPDSTQEEINRIPEYDEMRPRSNTMRKRTTSFISH